MRPPYRRECVRWAIWMESPRFRLALPWHSTRLMQAEVGLADGTSQAHGSGEVIEKRASDLWQAGLWRRSVLFSPAWRLGGADAVKTDTRSASSAHADGAPATSGPRSDRARALIRASIHCDDDLPHCLRVSE